MLKETLKRTPLYTVLKWYREYKKRLRKRIYPLTLYFAHIIKYKYRSHSLAITKEPFFGDKQLIVSLTSFPERIPYVVKTLYSIMNQSVKPNKIILWLSKIQFPNQENDLIKELLELQNYGLTIRWLDDDIKSYKKLIPALIEYPNDVIITADDDLYYPNYWIERLVKSYLSDPKVVHTHCSTKIIVENDLIRFEARYGLDGDGSKLFTNTILGGSGTLYPPHVLYHDITKKDKFLCLAPTNDDIWFWAMALANNTKIKWIEGNMRKLHYVENSQEKTSCLKNINIRGERLIDIQTRRVVEEYKLINKIN